MASELLPQSRLRPTRNRPMGSQRNSNAVRASVLETALELGFGQNSTVANWIFNNPLLEEPEDLQPEPDHLATLDSKSDPIPFVVEAVTPALTSASNSASDESSSLNSPGNNAPSAAITTIQVHSHKPSDTEPPYVHFTDFPSDQLQLFSPFSLSPPDTHAGTRGISVGKGSRDPERSRSQDDNLRHNPPSPGSADTGYTSEGQYLSKTKAGKAKDKSGKAKGKKGSKSSEKDGEYASDGGYISASSNKSLGKAAGNVKSRAMAFFRRRPKKSARASDDEDEDSIPPVPAIPILPRPSSPKLLERRAAPSPTRSGFSPLTLNLTSPTASSSGRRVSKSPPPAHARASPPPQPGQISMPQRPPSPVVVSALVPTTSTSAAMSPLPPSIPGTPLSSPSSPPTSSPPIAGVPKSLTASSSRQHLCIPPPAPPPTLPLPQPPPTPSASPAGVLHSLPATPTTPSRRGGPPRSIPVVPGSTRPLAPRGAPSPFRPLLSPRTLPTAVPHTYTGEFLNIPENGQPNGREVRGRQRSGTAGLGNAPAFLQRRIQTPSPRHPPPDAPLPPSPCPTPATRPRTPIGTPSKFHEHFSSVSSMPLSQALLTPKSSPPLSVATLSGSSSGPSVRSSHISSISERSEEPAVRDRLNTADCSRPTTSTSTMSGSSYGQSVPSTFGRSFGRNLKSRFSDRSDVNSSVYSSTMPQDNGSTTTFDDDDIDVDDAAPKSCVDEDDASVYPPDDQTAGRRTMYVLEHGEPDENRDEGVVTGSHYWGDQDVAPAVPPLPRMPTRPGPGYF